MMNESFPFEKVFGGFAVLMFCCTLIESVGFGGFLFLALISAVLMFIAFHVPRKKDKDK